MRETFIAIAIALSLAQWTSTGAFGQDAKSSDALYQSFGGKPGLVKLMDSFMDGLLADPRMARHFKTVDQEQVKAQLVDQFCELMGGPCEYTGEDMKTVHMKQTITMADFNALVEVLQIAMDAEGIAFSDQNQLLARLAPMHRAIVTR